MAMPAIYASGMSMLFPGSPAQRRGQTLMVDPTIPKFSNDIDAVDWLSEIDMSMYLEVFLRNFSLNETKFMDRKRLQQIRMCDLPKMGISIYDHQLVIMDHINHSLEFEFHSPMRKTEVQKKMQERFPDREFGSSAAAEVASIHKLKIEDLHIPASKIGGKNRKNRKIVHPHMDRQRRRSFDKNVMGAITNMQTSHMKATELLREGDFESVEKISRAKNKTRRRSFHIEKDVDHSLHKKTHDTEWHDYNQATVSSTLGRKDAFEGKHEVPMVHGMDEMLSLVKGDNH